MEFNLLTIVLLSTICFVAGFIDSIAGGGGLLTIPAYLLAGIPPQYALGTNKFVATLGTSIATANFIHKKKVVLKIVLAGIVFTLSGSFIGSRLILSFNPEIVGKIIVFLLPVGVIATLLPKRNNSRNHDLSKIDYYFKIPLIAFVIGFYDGFFGPGTGSFLALSFYVFLKLNLVEATANAKVFNFLSNISALVVYIIGGKVFYLLGIPLAIANMTGNYLGSHLAIKKGDKVIKFFLILVLIILSGTLIWQYFIM